MGGNSDDVASAKGGARGDAALTTSGATRLQVPRLLLAPLLLIFSGNRTRTGGQENRDGDRTRGGSSGTTRLWRWAEHEANSGLRRFSFLFEIYKTCSISITFDGELA